MWKDLTHFDVQPLDLVVRGVCVYVFVLVLMRVGGKREMAQMSAVEFVSVLLISNAVQNSMNGGDNSLVGGLLLAAILLGMSWLIAYLSYRSKSFRVLVEGRPTVIIHKGRLCSHNLSRERLTIGELKIMLRKQGVHHLQEIHTAILESDGGLSITKVADLQNPEQMPLSHAFEADTDTDHARDANPA